MLTRKIGAIIRGRTSPTQLVLAGALGMAIGFVPVPASGLGALIVLVLLVFLLNTSLYVAGVAAIVGKALSVPLAFVSFALGRGLLEGPTEGLFRSAVNAPVLALLGLEYYSVAGGVVLGLIIGAAAGLALALVVKQFSKRVESMRADSERFESWSSKGFVKLALWVFFGGKGKPSKTKALPIRLTGVAGAVLTVGLAVVLQGFLAESILTSVVRSSLERANGATVDLGAVRLDAGAGRLEIDRLAMCDARSLDTDVLRASLVTADIDVSDLLRKRIAIDSMVLSDPVSGAKRATPGARIGPPRARPAPPRPGPGDENAKTIDDYVAEAQVWKDRLAKLRDWLDRASGPDQAPPEGDTPTSPEQRRTSRNDRIRDEVRRLGYARVRGDHLLEAAPTVLIRELNADGLRVETWPGEVFDARAAWLSTHPRLVEQPPTIDVTTRSGVFESAVVLAPSLTSTERSADVRFRGLDGTNIGQALAIAGTRPIDGGTVDLDLHAVIAPGGKIDAPLVVTLHGCTLAIKEVGSTKVDLFSLPIHLSGPFDSPAIRIEDEELTAALKKAGADALASRLEKEGDKLLDKLPEDVQDKIPDKAKDAAKGLLGDLLGGDKKNKKKDE